VNSLCAPLRQVPEQENAWEKSPRPAMAGAVMRRRAADGVNRRSGSRDLAVRDPKAPLPVGSA
jgi:hypothetical protein